MIIAVKANVRNGPIDFIGSVVISSARDSGRITRGWNDDRSRRLFNTRSAILFRNGQLSTWKKSKIKKGAFVSFPKE